MTVIKQSAKGKTYWYSRHVVDGKRTQVRIPELDPETGRKISTEKQRTAYDGKIAQQYAKGDLTTHGRKPFGELCTAWAETVLPTLGKGATIKAYKVALSRVMRDYTDAKGNVFNLSDLRLNTITPQHITLWLSHLSGFAWETRSNTLTLCRRVFKTGVEWGWITRNPATASTVKLQKKTVADKRVKHLSIDLIKALLDASENDTEYRRHAVFIGTGLRKSELIMMRESLINWDKYQYEICPEYGNFDNPSRTAISPKTHSSTQAVFFDDRLGQLLREQIRHIAAISLAAPSWPTTLSLNVESSDQTTKTKSFRNDFIWPIETRIVPKNLGHDAWREPGNLNTGHGMSRAFKRACRRAGIDDSHTLHDLRHTCASIMINQNENIKTVQRQMRHATATETLDTYSHMWSEQGHEAVEAVSKAIGW
jgi:integrase